jgi:phage replication O-like protein O
MTVSPQCENGFTRLANEIIEALMRTNLSAYQSRILWAIWRETYGHQKKQDWISNSQLAEMTGIKKGHVSRTIKELLTRNIVTKSGNKIGFCKDYTQWRELPKLVTVTNSGNKVTSSGIHSYLTRRTQKKKYIKKYISAFADDAPPSNGNGKIKSLFAYWNSLGIIQHREIDRFERSLTAALKTYSPEEIGEAMKNYKEILESPDHWFSHHWTLSDFLSRKNGIDQFLTVNKPFDHFRKGPKQ